MYFFHINREGYKQFQIKGLGKTIRNHGGISTPADMLKHSAIICILLSEIKIPLHVGCQGKPNPAGSGGSDKFGAEGLEDVTSLLLNLSYVGTQVKESILHLLLDGASQLGNMVSGRLVCLICLLIWHKLRLVVV